MVRPFLSILVVLLFASFVLGDLERRTGLAPVISKRSPKGKGGKSGGKGGSGGDGGKAKACDPHDAPKGKDANGCPLLNPHSGVYFSPDQSVSACLSPGDKFTLKWELECFDTYSETTTSSLAFVFVHGDDVFPLVGDGKTVTPVCATDGSVEVTLSDKIPRLKGDWYFEVDEAYLPGGNKILTTFDKFPGEKAKQFFEYTDSCAAKR